MTTTYCTDAQIDATELLARTALSAYSDAAVARGDAAITDYDALRVEAKRQILVALRVRGILEGSITLPEALQVVEVDLVLAMLFESVAQWNANTPDVYATKANFYRTRYEKRSTAVSPISGVRGVGSSFSWGRG